MNNRKLEDILDKQDEGEFKNKRLRSKQKILISYFVGNYAAHQSQKFSIKNSPIRDIEIDTPYFGG